MKKILIILSLFTIIANSYGQEMPQQTEPSKEIMQDFYQKLHSYDFDTEQILDYVKRYPTFATDSVIEYCVERILRYGELMNHYWRTDYSQSYYEIKIQESLILLNYLLSKGGSQEKKSKLFYQSNNWYSYETAKSLLMAGAVLSDDYNHQSSNVRFFLRAVEANDYEALDKISPIDNIINEYECTMNSPALVAAVQANNKEMVAYLLKRGADKNVPEGDVCYDDFIYGLTPFEIAKNNGYEDIMKLLE